MSMMFVVFTLKSAFILGNRVGWTKCWIFNISNKIGILLCIIICSSVNSIAYNGISFQYLNELIRYLENAIFKPIERLSTLLMMMMITKNHSAHIANFCGKFPRRSLSRSLAFKLNLKWNSNILFQLLHANPFWNSTKNILWGSDMRALHSHNPGISAIVWSNEWEKHAIYFTEKANTHTAHSKHTCLNMELFCHCLFGAHIF